MTSKLKRPAPCFFPSGVEEGGRRSDRTTGIRERGGYTSLLLLAHRLGSRGFRVRLVATVRLALTRGRGFYSKKKIRRVTTLKLNLKKKNPQRRYKTPTQRANFYVHGSQ